MELVIDIIWYVQKSRKGKSLLSPIFPNFNEWVETKFKCVRFYNLVALSARNVCIAFWDHQCVYNNSQSLQSAWMTYQQQCLWTSPLTLELSMNHIKDSWMTNSSDRSLIHLRAILTCWQLNTSEFSHPFSSLFRHLYIYLCNFHVISLLTCTAMNLQ